MQLWFDAPIRAVGFEITPAQLRRQIAKRAFAVNTSFSTRDRSRACVTGKNLDGRPSKPPSFVQGDGNRQRLLARSASRAPDSQGRAGVTRVPFRQQALDQRAYLIELAPEVRLLHGERVHHVAPLDTRGGVVFQ